MFKTIKTRTEHLVCNLAKDSKGQPYYQIWDKENTGKPLLLYVNAHTIHIAEEITNVVEHPYYKEMCDIIEMLAEEERNGGLN